MTTPPATVFSPRPGQLGTLATQLVAQAAALAGKDLVFDLTGVEFAGSQDLGALVALNRKVKAGGGRLSVVNVRPLVLEAFAVTRLDTILDVRPADTAV